MHISFNSLVELQEFMSFIGRKPAVDPAHMKTVAITVSELPDTDVAPGLSRPASEQYRDMTTAQSAMFDTGTPTQLPPRTDIYAVITPGANTETGLRRKRRTKAEMKAARTAPAAPDTEACDELIQPAVASVDTPQVDMFDVEDNPSPSNDAEPVDATPSARDIPSAGNPALWIAARAAEIGGIDAIEHMRKCREFIAAKGQQTYQRTFALAGLTSNILTYKPADYAHHLAAIEFLLAHPEVPA